MKICPKCNATLNDDASFCTQCGAPFSAQNNANGNRQAPNGQPNQQNWQYVNQGQPYAPPFDPTDHTTEFDPRDIHENKVMAMLPYLLSWIGVIVALIAAKNSPFTMFHVRQAVKILVIEAVMGVITALLVWTIIVPVAFVVCEVILFVVKIICFFNVCGNKAKEPAIVKNFSFLK